MKVWIVKLDNHDYDFINEWYAEHAYASEVEAKKQANRMEAKYWKENPGSKKRGMPNVEILEFNVVPSSNGRAFA